MPEPSALPAEPDLVATLYRVGAAVSADLDLGRIIQTVTDAGTELTGAEFGAFFYNVVDERGESYVLYTLSGAPEEAFADLPMPRNTKIFAPTFAGQGVIRSDDVTADPRYGHNLPYDGMPPGHLPVVSYLAVPVVGRTGEVLGGLFFGHSRPAVFTETSERLVVGLATQAAVAIENARLLQGEQQARREAERSARRLALLHEVSAGLTEARDSAAVVDVICTGVRSCLAAAAAAVLRLDEPTGRLVAMGGAGLPPAMRERYAATAVGEHLPAQEALRRGSTVVVRSRMEFVQRYPHAALPYFAALAAVPMRLDDRVVGVLMLHWTTERDLPGADRATLEALGRQGAQALDRALLFEAAQEARGRAEEMAARLGTLQDVTARLGEAHDSAAVADVVVEQASAAAGSACALLLRVDDARDALTVVTHRGIDESLLPPRMPLGLPLPGNDAVTTGRPVVIGSLAERDARYPLLAGTPDGGHYAYVTLPLLVEERAVGALVLGWEVERTPSSAEVAFLEALARQCALALARAWLLEAEHEARRTAERTAERLRGQQELTARLAGAVDTEAVADVIVRHAARALGASGAVLTRFDERRRTFDLLASHRMAHVDRDFRHFSLDEALPPCDAIRTRRPVVVRDRAERDRRYPRLGVSAAEAQQAFVSAPLLFEDRPLGALGLDFGAALPERDGDIEFIQAIANLCAQALERARLYDATREVAHTLQASLLPPRPPAIPGLEVAVRYRPVGRRTEVGGDFYDVFRVAPGRWGVVIGDVSGKGVPAASLTALARHTVRSAARRETSPSEVLAVLNEAVLEAAADDDRFCTVAYLDVEPCGARTRVRLTVGGHPLPVLRTAAGDVRPVGTPGMAIGLLPMADVDDTVLDLEPGDTLVLVTDGVAEARSPDGRFAADLVSQVLLGSGGPDDRVDAETVADRIERATLDFQAGDPRDDLAVVVLRVPDDTPGGAAGAAVPTLRVRDDVTLEFDPQSAAAARRAVSLFLHRHGLAHLEEAAVLLTSELVTNAVVHARTAVGLRIGAVGDRLQVAVSDGSRVRPVRRDLGVEATYGRGLFLLDRLATTWDVRRTPDGKTVWFELDLSQPARTSR